MTLPPIPDEAIDAAVYAITQEYEDGDEAIVAIRAHHVLDLAWPHLYAAALAPVLALHQQSYDDALWCDHDGFTWPCATYRAAASPDSRSDADRTIAALQADVEKWKRVAEVNMLALEPVAAVVADLHERVRTARRDALAPVLAECDLAENSLPGGYGLVSIARIRRAAVESPDRPKVQRPATVHYGDDHSTPVPRCPLCSPPAEATP